MSSSTLVLWDVDRTLLCVEQTERSVYQDAFGEVVGRPAARMPEPGTGRTTPVAVLEMMLANDIPQGEAEQLAQQMMDLMPVMLAARAEELREHGQVMPGARAALKAMHATNDTFSTLVTGNLQSSARIKLQAVSLADLVDLGIGGYASDDPHRPALVAVAQQRAAAKHGGAFHRGNTVITGDSLEDVRTGIEGGAFVIAVASGASSGAALLEAGADRVLPDLKDAARLVQLVAELVG
ncbi:haloacid dehalogenase-like hydrolase [Kitasatospora aureofaciens]|uniref:HAD family hydrolase n=1 Tax=Kitasatospora aureofaciens TaxID=1894 RepID=UPI001C463AEB|nr:haloacid dehalogenase-like hydrolase [Kitasatospora aureofaciens]MBV6695633.1 haloacid dehalogenase-like hydrolase [Kitasatospora aureofaciens]